MRGENCRPARLKIANVARVCPAVSVVCSAIGRSVGLPKMSSSTATASRQVVGMTVVP
jgi:hypothetical protein